MSLRYWPATEQKLRALPEPEGVGERSSPGSSSDASEADYSGASAPSGSESDPWLVALDNVLKLSALRLGLYATAPNPALAEMDEPIRNLIRLCRDRLQDRREW